MKASIPLAALLLLGAGCTDNTLSSNYFFSDDSDSPLRYQPPPGQHIEYPVVVVPESAPRVQRETPEFQPVPYAGPSDPAITKALQTSLDTDPALSPGARNVGITTLNGIVTLRGQVPLQSDRDIISAKAASMPSVLRVEDKLEVAPGAPR